MVLSSTIVFLLLAASAVAFLVLVFLWKGLRGADARLAALMAERDAARRDAERHRSDADGERTERVRQQADREASDRQVVSLEARLVETNSTLERLRQEVSTARQELAAARTQIERDQHAFEDKLAMLTAARTELSDQFKAVAGEILEEKSRRFTEQNSASLGTVLTPLREKLGEFQARVEALKEDGIAGRSELKTHIESLRSMNDRLSIDANNLVKALKGSSKTQGDWGEVLLIGILEDAGLRLGKEYRVQETFATEEGRHVRPDIILDLPQGKHLVIDSKLSLNSYTEYCACDDDASRRGFLERHTRSLRDHIDGLSKKAYQGLHQLQSLDFVVMFVPIEPAYLLALAHDSGLWQRAWTKDVLLVSPSTLYPILRTIQYAWQQERQSRNVEDIVRQGGALYDKVALFATSFEEVGKKLGGAQTSFDKAMGQLATGRGNVLVQIEKMRRLGIKKKRAIPLGLTGPESLSDGLLEADGEGNDDLTSDGFENIPLPLLLHGQGEAPERSGSSN